MDVDDHMPIRIIGYDGVSYRSQLLKGWKGNHCPVITLVLYYGDRSWDQPSALAEELPEIEKLHGSDYQFHVFHIPNLTDEQIQSSRAIFGLSQNFLPLKGEGRNIVGAEKRYGM